MLAALIASQTLVALVSAAPTPNSVKSGPRQRADCLQKVFYKHSWNDDGIENSMSECLRYGKWKERDNFDHTEVQGCYDYCDRQYGWAGNTPKSRFCQKSCSKVYGSISDARDCKTNCQVLSFNQEDI